MADKSLASLSSRCPRAELQARQSRPRIAPVAWSWSTLNGETRPLCRMMYVSGRRQMAQAPPCASSIALYPSRSIPNLDFKRWLRRRSGLLRFHSLYHRPPVRSRYCRLYSATFSGFAATHAFLVSARRARCSGVNVRGLIRSHPLGASSSSPARHRPVSAARACSCPVVRVARCRRAARPSGARA